MKSSFTISYDYFCYLNSSMVLYIIVIGFKNKYEVVKIISKLT